MCIGVLYTYICKIYAIIFRFSCTRCTNAAISLTHGNLQPPTTYSPFVLGSFLSRNIFFDFFFLSIQRKEKRLKDDWPRLSLVLIVQYEIKQDERQAVLSRRKELASTEIIFSPNESRRARVWTENRRMRGETRWTLFYVLEFIHRRETDKRRTGRGPKKKRREKNREGELIQVSWLKSVVVIVVVLVSYRGSYNVSSTVVFIFKTPGFSLLQEAATFWLPEIKRLGMVGLLHRASCSEKNIYEVCDPGADGRWKCGFRSNLVGPKLSQNCMADFSYYDSYSFLQVLKEKIPVHFSLTLVLYENRKKGGFFPKKTHLIYYF